MELPKILNEEMKEIFKETYINDKPESLEVALQILKNKGYSQMQSIFLLIEILNLSFIEANRTILNSKAWNITK